MHSNLDTWIDAQRNWINLDVIFNSNLFAGTFGANTKAFVSCRLQYQRIMWSSYKNPQAIYNLMIESRMEIFRELSGHFKVLQKKVHDFLEAKRLAFSRFFFLNDSQFLEFLTLANTGQDFTKYINTLFMGAHSLYIQPADQLKLLKADHNADIAGSKPVTPSEREDSLLSEDGKGLKTALAGQPSADNTNMGLEGVNEYQVLGMLSQNKELFLFEAPVLIENDNKAVREVEGYDVSGTGTGNVE